MYGAAFFLLLKARDLWRKKLTLACSFGGSGIDRRDENCLPARETYGKHHAALAWPGNSQYFFS
jgi:hypothetical protein